MFSANFSEEVVASLPDDLQTGIYFGWTQLEGEPDQIRKAVVSIGWNPFFHNSKKSVVSATKNDVRQ
jgi:riboflavin kinase